MHIKKLIYMCRRGTKELDLLTSQYLALHYPNASLAHQQLFEQLLQLEDTDLYDWIHRDGVPSCDGDTQLKAAIELHIAPQ